jgi:N-terminal acetyltransferase B complex catalytic subunit
MDILETLSSPPPQADSADSTDSASGTPSGKGGGRDSVDAWFVDLFVRCNNTRAVEMYEKMGYSVYRRVVE